MEVTETVFQQYQQVQRAGPVNMSNKSGVQRAANDMGLHDLVAFIEEGDYYEILMNYESYKDEFGTENA